MSFYFSAFVRNFHKYLLAFILIIAVSGLTLPFAFAADQPNPFVGEIGEIVPCYGGECEKAPEVAALPQSNLRDVLLPLVIQFLIYSLSIVSFLVFFSAGAYLVLGWGEEESIKKAKHMVIYSLLGLAIAAAAYTFVKAILQLEWGFGGGATTSTVGQAQPPGATPVTPTTATNSALTISSSSAIAPSSPSAVPEPSAIPSPSVAVGTPMTPATLGAGSPVQLAEPTPQAPTDAASQAPAPVDKQTGFVLNTFKYGSLYPENEQYLTSYLARVEPKVRNIIEGLEPTDSKVVKLDITFYVTIAPDDGSDDVPHTGLVKFLDDNGYQKTFTKTYNLPFVPDILDKTIPVTVEDQLNEGLSDYTQHYKSN